MSWEHRKKLLGELTGNPRAFRRMVACAFSSVAQLDESLVDQMQRSLIERLNFGDIPDDADLAMLVSDLRRHWSVPAARRSIVDAATPQERVELIEHFAEWRADVLRSKRYPNDTRPPSHDLHVAVWDEFLLFVAAFEAGAEPRFSRETHLARLIGRQSGEPGDRKAMRLKTFLEARLHREITELEDGGHNAPLAKALAAIRRALCDLFPENSLATLLIEMTKERRLKRGESMCGRTTDA